MHCRSRGVKTVSKLSAKTASNPNPARVKLLAQDHQSGAVSPETPVRAASLSKAASVSEVMARAKGQETESTRSAGDRGKSSCGRQFTRGIICGRCACRLNIMTQEDSAALIAISHKKAKRGCQKLSISISKLFLILKGKNRWNYRFA